jgi:AcrR family transcriptional regulator
MPVPTGQHHRSDPTTKPPGQTARRAGALPPEERRRAIIEAAMPLVARLGRQVTTRQIAEAAGVAEGTLFRVFVDKDELVVATAEALLDPEPLERALASIDRAEPFEEQLAEAVQAIERRIVGVWQLFGVLGHELRSQLVRPMDDSDALIALLEPHANRLRTEPRRAARLLRSVVLSLTHPMLSGEPSEVSEIVDFFCHGALAPQEHRALAPQEHATGAR